MYTKKQQKIYTIIFGDDTKAGKTFDIILLILILFSVIIVLLDSVSYIREQYLVLLYTLEWLFTLLFTAEYILRIYSSPRRRSYIFSFYGVIDLLAILPTYLSLFFIGTKYLVIIRILRLLRVFRILKLAHFYGASRTLAMSLKSSRYKIIVFLGSILSIVTVMGSLMYIIEGSENGFDSIPRSIYWAIVTLTTVGYGDIAPNTVLGQAVASLIMIMGYSIIAVPTGIITVEMSRRQDSLPDITCQDCGNTENDHDARYCKKCGERLHKKKVQND